MQNKIWSKQKKTIIAPLSREIMNKWKKNLKKNLWPLFMDGVQLPQGYSHFEEAVYFLPLSPQKFLVLTLSNSEGWKAKSTLEPPSGFEHGTPGLGIQCLSHLAKSFCATTNIQLGKFKFKERTKGSLMPVPQVDFFSLELIVWRFALAH